MPRGTRESPAMTRTEILQALLDAREPLDKICMNQGFGLLDDAVVTSDQCARLQQIVGPMSDVLNAIDATDRDEPSKA
jgi:hypothetical protein